MSADLSCNLRKALSFAPLENSQRLTDANFRQTGGRRGLMKENGSLKKTGSRKYD